MATEKRGRIRLNRYLKAETPWARRLEAVRLKRGYTTLTEFWEALQELPGFDTSYSAARGYHVAREPSAAYLTAVVLRFDVDAHWLLTGYPNPAG